MYLVNLSTEPGLKLNSFLEPIIWCQPTFKFSSLLTSYIRKEKSKAKGYCDWVFRPDLDCDIWISDFPIKHETDFVLSEIHFSVFQNPFLGLMFFWEIRNPDFPIENTLSARALWHMIITIHITIQNAARYKYLYRLRKNFFLEMMPLLFREFDFESEDHKLVSANNELVTVREHIWYASSVETRRIFYR